MQPPAVQLFHVSNFYIVKDFLQGFVLKLNKLPQNPQIGSADISPDLCWDWEYIKCFEIRMFRSLKIRESISTYQ